MFGCTYSPLQHASVRCLMVHNKQARSKYTTETVKQIKHHNILACAESLYNKAQCPLFSNNDRQALFRLDKQLTEILLSGERKCSKRSIQKDPWSPSLKEKGKAVIYWRQKLANLSCPDDPIPVSLSSLEKAAGVSDTLHQSANTVNACK